MFADSVLRARCCIRLPTHSKNVSTERVGAIQSPELYEDVSEVSWDSRGLQDGDPKINVPSLHKLVSRGSHC